MLCYQVKEWVKEISSPLKRIMKCASTYHVLKTIIMYRNIFLCALAVLYETLINTKQVLTVVRVFINSHNTPLQPLLERCVDPVHRFNLNKTLKYHSVQWFLRKHRCVYQKHNLFNHLSIHLQYGEDSKSLISAYSCVSFHIFVGIPD